MTNSRKLVLVTNQNFFNSQTLIPAKYIFFFLTRENKYPWKLVLLRYNKTIVKERYFLEVDVQYLEKLHEFHNEKLLPERMEIEKVEKLVANWHDKTEYVLHIRKLKKALNHGLVF